MPCTLPCYVHEVVYQSKWKFIRSSMELIVTWPVRLSCTLAHEKEKKEER